MDIFGREKKKREAIKRHFEEVKEARQALEAILRSIKRTTDRGQCVILGQSPLGTRVIVLGQPSVLSQAEEILRRKGEKR